MAIEGVMVTFTGGTQVPSLMRRLIPSYIAAVRDRDETRLKDIHRTYLQYYSGDLDVLALAIETFCTEEVFDELNELLTLNKHSTKYIATRHPTGEVTMYAEGRPGWLLKMAMALDFGPHLKMRDDYVY